MRRSRRAVQIAASSTTSTAPIEMIATYPKKRRTVNPNVPSYSASRVTADARTTPVRATIAVTSARKECS